MLEKLFQKEWGKALFAGTLLLFTLGIAISPLFTGRIIFEDDVTNYYLPAFKFYSDIVRGGGSVAMTGGVFSGFPLALTQVGGFLDPLNWLLFKILPFLVAYHMRIALNYFLGGFFAYLFARSLRLSFLSSLLTMFAYVTAQYIVPDSNILRSNSLYLMPALFFVVHMLWLLRDEAVKKSVIPLFIGVIVCVISFLGGYTQLNIYSLVAVGLFATFLAYQDFTWRFVLSCMGMLFTSALLLAPYFSAVLKLVAESARAGGLPWSQASASVSGVLYLQNLTLNLFWPPTDDTTLQSLYIGILALFFFGVSLCMVRKNKQVLFFFALLALSILCAFPYPLFAMLHLLPVFNLFRFPPHWFFVSSFAMAVLAGFGMEYVRKNTHTHSLFIFVQKKLDTPTIIPLVVIVLVLNVIVPMRFAIASYSISASQLSEMPWVDSEIHAHEGEGHAPFRTFQPYAAPMNSFLIESQYQFSLDEKYELNKEFVQTHLTSLLWGVDSVVGFDNLVSRRYARVLAYLEKVDPQTLVSPARFEKIDDALFTMPHEVFPILGMMNVKYIWTTVALSPTTTAKDATLVGSTYFHKLPVPFHLYTVNAVLPRVYVPKTIVTLPESEDTFHESIETTHDFADIGFIECHCEKKKDATQGTVVLSDEAFTDGSVSFTADVSADSWVVISNSNTPGWEAHVDGKKTPISYANYIYQGIRIPKGKHVVRLRARAPYDFLFHPNVE